MLSKNKLVVDGRNMSATGIGRVISAFLDGLDAIERKKVTLICLPQDCEYLQSIGYTSLLPEPPGNILVNQYLYWKLSKSHQTFLSFTVQVPFIKFFEQQYTYVHDVIQIERPFLNFHSIIFFFIFITIKFNTDTIIFNSEFSKERFCNLVGMPKKSKVVSPAFPSSLPEKQKLLGSREVDPPYILYYGNVRKNKNIHALCMAFNNLQRENAIGPVKLVLATSEMSIPRKIKSIIQRSTNIILLQGLGDCKLASLIDESEVVCFPSSYEGYGMGISEVTLRGKRVIVSNIPTFRSQVCAENMMFDPHNIDDMSDKIAQVLSLPKSYHQDIDGNNQVQKKLQITRKNFATLIQKAISS